MKRILLEETKISSTLAVSFEQEDDEIGFNIGNFSSMTVYGLELEAWKQFVKAVLQANLMRQANEEIS